MGEIMANSQTTMARIERLESALVHITDLLVLQGERMDYGFTSLREEMQGMRQEMQGMRQSVQSVGDRLDRLMAITTKERTSNIERLLSIEARLARLEERG